MRIAVVSSSFPPYGGGGVTSAHYNLFRGLSRRGYEIRAFTFQDEVSERGPAVSRYGASRLTKKLIYYLLRVYFRLRGCRREAYQLYDILQSFAAMRISRDLKKFKPDVVILPDHGAPALYLKKPDGARFIWVSHHNPDRFMSNSLIPEHCAHDASLAIRLEEVALRKVDHVVCPSEYMREAFLDTYRYGGGISVVPNLIDSRALSSVPPSDPRREMGVPEDAPVVYIPSAGSVYKGSDYVAEIMRGITEGYGGQIGFLLSGHIAPELLQEFKKAGPEVRYFAPGKLPYENNISWLKSCTVCVSPTLMESFGMALLEAIVCGIPVVAFDTEATTEVVKDGRNGYLVPLPDTMSMIKKSLELITGGGDSGFTESGRRKPDESYSEEAALDRYAQLIEEVIAGSP